MTKKQTELLKYIEYQLTLTLFDLVVHNFTKRKYITLDISKMNESDERRITSLGFMSGKYRVEPNGYQKIAIILT